MEAYLPFMLGFAGGIKGEDLLDYIKLLNSLKVRVPLNRGDPGFVRMDVGPLPEVTGTDMEPFKLDPWSRGTLQAIRERPELFGDEFNRRLAESPYPADMSTPGAGREADKLYDPIEEALFKLMRRMKPEYGGG